MFRALRTRDGAAKERDGQPIFEVNELRSAREPVVEARFADGMWMLCGPDDVVPGFTLDAYPGHVWLAHHYGDTWHGWATPVVERHVVEDLLAVTGALHAWRGTDLIMEEDESLLHSSTGLYDLGELG